MSVKDVDNDYVRLTYQIRELYLPNTYRGEMFALKGVLSYVAAGGDYPSNPYKYGLRKKLDVIAAELGCEKEFFKRTYKSLKEQGLVHTKAITKTGRVRWVDRNAVEALWSIQRHYKEIWLAEQIDLDEDEMEEDPEEGAIWDCPDELRLLETASLPIEVASIDALSNRTTETNSVDVLSESNSPNEQSTALGESNPVTEPGETNSDVPWSVDCNEPHPLRSSDGTEWKCQECC